MKVTNRELLELFGVAAEVGTLKGMAIRPQFEITKALTCLRLGALAAYETANRELAAKYEGKVGCQEHVSELVELQRQEVEVAVGKIGLEELEPAKPSVAVLTALSFMLDG